MHTSDLGDHIGMESCVDLETDTYTALSSAGGVGFNRKPWGLNKRRSSMSGRTVKELPPPLPMQNSTVLKRYYTDDGRLIIAEEKIESPKYHFTAHRSNGRLTLRLVPSELSKKETMDSDNGGNAAVKVAAIGPCLFVGQNQHLAVRPVQI
ncbi:hypothetical protein L1987_52487 [Smallanthus sonchifolius]|uniref:Uncharacterized protein n=1 Tax=Smallanthus sonchifolius TaxID=185202 RepID=A0ACB9ET80_9ASTR|nr:hypothetical protein L1987_52487 [Smallanthus sonchifolius]